MAVPSNHGGFRAFVADGIVVSADMDDPRGGIAVGIDTRQANGATRRVLYSGIRENSIVGGTEFRRMPAQSLTKLRGLCGTVARTTDNADDPDGPSYSTLLGSTAEAVQAIP